MNEFDLKIKQLEKELAEAKAEKKRVEELEFNLSIEQLLAITLHDICCRTNHDDGCGWYYDISGGVHIWNGASHANWLHKAVTCAKVADDVGIGRYSARKFLQGLKAAGIL